jgi:hypothetical protein
MGMGRLDQNFHHHCTIYSLLFHDIFRQFHGSAVEEIMLLHLRQKVIDCSFSDSC